MLANVTRPDIHLLTAQPWFRRLPTNMASRVVEEVFTLWGDKGDVMLRAGEPVEGWYAVVTGLVKLQSRSPRGRLSVFLGMAAGDWFGEGSALKAENRRYEVVALRETCLMCLPLQLFNALRSTHLEFNQTLVAQLNMRLSQGMAVIEAERVHSPEQRVALSLSRLFWHGRKRLDLSQEELGNLAGLSRQTVNRILQKMQQDGLVTLACGRVNILNEHALSLVMNTAKPDWP